MRFVLVSAIVAIVAPILGAVVAVRVRPWPSRTGASRRIANVSCLLAIGAGFGVVTAAIDAWQQGQGHASWLPGLVVGAAGAGLAGVAHGVRAWSGDPLDGAAAGIALGLFSTLGVLVCGGWVESLPASLTAAALAVSPATAGSAAAGVDILHDQWLYRLSPLAHVQVPPVQWALGAGAWLGVAVLSAVAADALAARTDARLEPGLD